MKRSVMLRRVASILDMAAQEHPHPLRVAIDGPDAAGKTTLANQIAYALEHRQPNSDLPAETFHHNPRTIRISADDYLNPPEIRHQRGRHDAVGYVRHSLNYDALLHYVLRPMGTGRRHRCLTRFYDRIKDACADPKSMLEPAEVKRAAPGMILLVDGIFLQRSRIRSYWDFVIYVSVAPETSLARGLARARKLRVGETSRMDLLELESVFRKRYLPAQELYRRWEDPERMASLIIENDDPDYPQMRWA